MIKRVFAALLALALTAGAAACSSVDTDPRQVALHYSGGSWEAQTFKSCVPSSTLEVANSAGDHYYYYPTGDRTYEFRGDGNAENVEQGAIEITSSDRISLKVSGLLNFTLNTDCEPFTDKGGKQWPGGHLQMFHERFNKDRVAPEESGQEMTGGWRTMLVNRIGGPLNQLMDQMALRYSVAQLDSDPTKKDEWQKAVLDELQNRIDASFGGERVIEIREPIIIDKPDIPQSLKDVIAEGEAIRQRGVNAAQEKAIGEAWPGGPAAYDRHLIDLAVQKAINEGRVQVIPVPAGSDVLVNGGNR